MQKVGALAWLAIVLSVCIIAGVKGPSFESSVMALLPQSEQSPHSAEAIEAQSNNLGQHLTLMVQHQDAQQARITAHYIRALFSESDLLLEQSPDDLQHAPIASQYRFSVLSANVQQRLEQGHFNAQTNIALSQLFNPVANTPIDLVADPFSLYASYLQDSTANSNVNVQHDLFRVTTEAAPTFVLFYKLTKNAFSIDTQSTLTPLLSAVRNYAQTNQVTLRLSGLVIHASYGAKQAKQEISTIGIGSLVGITLLILMTFRRLKALLYILLPVSIGAITALAITTLIFPSVHLITFAFGAGLVGVAVDYSMHYVCAQTANTHNRLTKALVIGLFLGLISSVLAYAGLALTPFPGLRQIAVFSSIGLIASWLTVIFWLPLFQSLAHLPLHIKVMQALVAITPCYSDKRRKMAALTAMACACTSASIIYLMPANDGLEALQTSPKSLLIEDRSVQQALGSRYQSAFLLITASDIEHVLQQEEQVRHTLAPLVAQDALDAYQSITQTLPSMAQQQRNLTLVEQLYTSELSQIMTQIGASPDLSNTATMYMLEHPQTLNFETWQTSSAGQLMQNQLITHANGDVSSIIRFSGDMSDTAKDQLRQLATQSNDVEYVDPVGNISDTLKRYREQLTLCLLLAYLVVSCLLLIRYRREVWHVILPPVCASMMAFALATLINDGYNLFNTVALMLVFGIGLDMGIFIKESRGTFHTWLAVSLSTVTSLLAFGLLILSNTPVLYHFGIIVLPGLLLVWLLTPFIQPISYGENRNE